MVVKFQTHYYNNRRKNPNIYLFCFSYSSCISEYSIQKLEVLLYRIINSEGILELEHHHFATYNEIINAKTISQKIYRGNL